MYVKANTLLILGLMLNNLNARFLEHVHTVTTTSAFTQTLDALKKSSAFKASIASSTIETLADAVVTRIANRQNKYPKFADSRSIYTGRAFRPYVEKYVVPHDARVFFWGDLHGEVETIITTLKYLHDQSLIDEQFKLTDTNTFLVFLGDVVDRGNRGIETMYVLLRLLQANPEQVRWVRGNHEDINQNCAGGFIGEIFRKYPEMRPKGSKVSDSSLLALLASLYEALPVALFLGAADGNGIAHYTLCVHGGMELGYDPRTFLASEEIYDWASKLNRKEMLGRLDDDIRDMVEKVVPAYELSDMELVRSPVDPAGHGFMWSDFVPSGDHCCGYKHGRGWIYGYDLTSELLSLWSTDTVFVTNVMRAHQHHGEMLEKLIAQDGLVALWDGQVHTVLSAPVARTGFNKHAFVERNYSGSAFTMQQHVFDV